MFEDNNSLYKLRTEIQESDSTVSGDVNDIPENCTLLEKVGSA